MIFPGWLICPGSAFRWVGPSSHSTTFCRTQEPGAIPSHKIPGKDNSRAGYRYSPHAQIQFQIGQRLECTCRVKTKSIQAPNAGGMARRIDASRLSWIESQIENW